MLHSLKSSNLSAVTLFAALLLASPAVTAGAQSSAPPATVAGALRGLASRAGTAFAGQVVSIKSDGGVVEITFSVDQPLLGAAGSSFTLREWGGLWPPGQHRYLVGQRVMIFLNPVSTAGLSSPVDGMNGIIPIVIQTDAAGTLLLDVRRISANLQRANSQPLPADSSSGILLADAAQIVTHWRQPLRHEPGPLPLPQPHRQPIQMPEPGRTAPSQPIQLPVMPISALQEGLPNANL